jgi:hypothetical protein
MTMKLRNPWLIGLASFLGALAIRCWMSTVRYRFRSIVPAVHPNDPDLAGRYIYAVWHESLLAAVGRRLKGPIYALISQHADGELIAQIGERLGYPTIRGSTTRGGARALREMVRKGQEGHLFITPDGPRGPRRQVQPGIIYAASRTGLPIVPVGVGYRKAWRARSWDRFAVPRPFSVVYGVAGAPIAIPPDIERKDLEHYRVLVEQAMLEVTAAAEEWVAGITPSPLGGEGRGEGLVRRGWPWKARPLTPNPSPARGEGGTP